MEVTRKKSRYRWRGKFNMSMKTLLQLLLPGTNSFPFCPHSSFWTSPLTPRLSTWFLLPSPLPQFFLCQHIYCLPLPSLFWRHSYSSLLISNKKNCLLGSWLISLQISQILCVSSLVQASSTNYSPRTRIFHFSLSFLCECTHLMQLYFIIKKIPWLFSSYSSSPHSQNYSKFMVTFVLFFFPFSPPPAAAWLPLSTHCGSGTADGKIVKAKEHISVFLSGNI